MLIIQLCQDTSARGFGEDRDFRRQSICIMTDWARIAGDSQRVEGTRHLVSTHHSLALTRSHITTSSLRIFGYVDRDRQPPAYHTFGD